MVCRRYPGVTVVGREARSRQWRVSSAESDAGEPAQFGLPSRPALALESRGLAELSAFYTVAPLLGLGRRGDGHPALILPGVRHV